MNEPKKHIPVLLNHVVDLLDPKSGDSYFDGTAGYGGHASAVAALIGDGQMILVDRDQNAVNALTEKFKGEAEIKHQDYLSATKELVSQGWKMDMVLLDLGVSSPQLDEGERGFSFMNEGPLDMRMDRSQSRTAADIINSIKEEELADIIYQYGEDRKSRRIARAIMDNRPLSSTKQLAEIIVKTVGRSQDVHPATRTFQALRIYLNNELDQLQSALPLLTQMLNPGGRIVVISFHSLEDRIVKDFFNSESKDCICPPKQPVCNCHHTASLKKITKRPVSGKEDAFNPRARSAKLRAAMKLNQNKEIQ